MYYFIFYIIGVIIFFIWIILEMRTIRDVTLSDIFMAFFVSLISWIGIIFWIFLFLRNKSDDIIVIKKKNQNGEINKLKRIVLNLLKKYGKYN